MEFCGYELSLLEISVLAVVTLFFLLGVVEDLTSNLTAKIRFLAMILAALGLAWLIDDLQLSSVGIGWVDWILELATFSSLLFTALCAGFFAQCLQYS